MAVNKRITECAEDTSPVFGDWLATVDVSDTTDSVDGTTKKAKSLNVTGRGINPQTGTTYTYLTTDFGKLVTHNNGASIAGTLPQSGATFPAKWYMFVQNYGAGVLTITPTTSTIDGATTLVLNQNEGALIVSDGTNYFTMRGKGGSGGSSVATVVASTVTGAQNNYAPTLSSHTLIPWSGASDAAFTGIAGGSAGMLVTIKNTGTKVATFAHNSGSSSAGNKLINIATSAPTPIAPGGWITYQHDGTQWQLVSHEQGAWITPTFSGGNFSGAPSMTWTVDSGDVQAYSYYLSGKTLSVYVYATTTSVSGTINPTLQVTIPGAFTPVQTTICNPISITDNGSVKNIGDYVAYVTPGSPTKIVVTKAGGTTNWTASTNLTDLSFLLSFLVN